MLSAFVSFVVKHYFNLIICNNNNNNKQLTDGLGSICSRGLSFLVEISNRLAAISGEAQETSFLFQRVSVLIQRLNQIAFRGTFIDGNDTEG